MTARFRHDLGGIQWPNPTTKKRRRRGAASSRQPACWRPAIAAPAVLRIRAAFAAYPDRPIKIVVANTPGGPSDIIARIMAAAMQEAMGGSVFVENKGGAGGNIGMGLVARAEPDGYTILLTTSAYVGQPRPLQTRCPYDPFKDFVADLRARGLAARVRGASRISRAKTMKEFVALAKKPTRTSSTSRRRRSAPRRSCRPRCSSCARACRRWRPWCSRAAATRSRRCSPAPCSCSSGVLAPAHPHIKAGNIKGLAVTGTTRWHDLPDIPTMVEAGLQGLRVRHLHAR